MKTRREFLQQSTLATIGATVLSNGVSARETNQRIVLASRPTGSPTVDNFRLEQQAVPALEDGQILLRTLYLSLDPYMRGRMSAAESYAAPNELDAVMGGLGRSDSPVIHQGNSILPIGSCVITLHSAQRARGVTLTGAVPRTTPIAAAER